MDSKIYRALKQLKTVGLIGEGTRVVRRRKRSKRSSKKRNVKRKAQGMAFPLLPPGSGGGGGGSGVMSNVQTVQSDQALLNLRASELALKNALQNNASAEEKSKIVLAIEDIKEKEDMYKNAIGHILHKVKALENNDKGYVVDEPDEEEEEVKPPITVVNPFPHDRFTPQGKAPPKPTPVEEVQPATFTVPSTPAFETPKTGTPAGSLLFNPLNPYAPFGGKFAFTNMYSTATKKKAAEDEEKERVKVSRDSYWDISDAEQEDEPVKRTPEKETKFPAATATPKSNIPPPVEVPRRKRIKYQNLFADEEEPPKPAAPEPAKEAPAKAKSATWQKTFDDLVQKYRDAGGNDPSIFNAKTYKEVKSATSLLKPKQRYRNLGGKDPEILQSNSVMEVNNAIDDLLKQQTSTTRKKSKK